MRRCTRSELWRGELAAGVVLATALVQVAASAEPTFRSIGERSPGSHSFAFAISSDGTTVVGDSGGHAFRWTQVGGMEDLGLLPNGYITIAWGVSSNGSVVVGEALSSGTGSRAFRWTAQTGMVDLGFGPNLTQTRARGVSGDGSVVCGYVDSVPTSSFRWTAAEGYTLLGSLPGGDQSTECRISADGSTVAGVAGVSGQSFAYRWTAATGMQALPTPPGGSRAYALSADGSVIVGVAAGGVCRWFNGATFEIIPGISEPNGVSADGNVIIGTTAAGSQGGAYLWTPQRDVMHIQTLLGSAVPPGWSLAQGWGVSADGLRICGWGYNPAGQNEGWYATLTPDMVGCYGNCDSSTQQPILNVNDFICFQATFAAGNPAANCDLSTSPPVLNVNDFVCFQAKFAAGCP